MARLDAHQIQAIKDRTVLSEIVGQRVVWDKRKTNPGKQDYWACCPFHGERRPSFHVDDRRKMFKCFGCGVSGDVITWLMEFEGLKFVDALKQLAGGDIPEATEHDLKEYRQRQQELKRRQTARENNVRQLAWNIWNSGIPIIGTPAARYLQNRGANLDIGFPSLKYVDELEYPDEEKSKWCALVAAVQGPDARFKGIWRIYLHPGGGKARVPNPKLGLGPCGGGAVWLGRPGEKINVCEGLETGFGVRGIIGGKEPVACTLSTSGMINFECPEITKHVLIWPDGDIDKIRQTHQGERLIKSPGLEAANTLRDRLGDQVAVAIQPTPKTGRDYLDTYNAMQRHG